MDVDSRPIIGAELDIEIIAGKNLVAKDRSLFGKKSSDPFVVISCGSRTLGTTRVIDKSLDPVWNETFKLNIDGKSAANMEQTEILLSIFDKDKLSSNVPGSTQWPYTVAPTSLRSLQSLTQGIAAAPGTQ